MKNTEIVSNIIRCKECLFRQSFQCPMFDQRYSNYYEKLETRDMTWDDGFCHYGMNKSEKDKPQGERITNYLLLYQKEK